MTPNELAICDERARRVMASFDVALADARSQMQDIPLAGDERIVTAPSPADASSVSQHAPGSGQIRPLTPPHELNPWSSWTPSPAPAGASSASSPPDIEAPHSVPRDPVLDGDWLPTGTDPSGVGTAGGYGWGGLEGYGLGGYGPAAGASAAGSGSAGAATGRSPAGSIGGSASASAGGGTPAAAQVRNGQSMMPMIPPAAATGTPAGRAGSGSGGVRPGGVPGNSYAAARRRTRGAEGWTVAQGVPPIIEPPPVCDEHDPGPGVIGGLS
jgi:hypothetical protein